MIAFLEPKEIRGIMSWNYQGIAKRIETIDKLTLCAYRRIVGCVGQERVLPSGVLVSMTATWLEYYEPGSLVIGYAAVKQEMAA